MMIESIIYLYFLINTFFAGVYYASHDRWIIGVVILIFLFTPLTIISFIIDISKDLYWKFINFTLIKVWYYYKKGKYKKLSDSGFEIAQKNYLDAKYDFQKRIWQNILNDNQ